jgi:DNA repair photolyase
VSVTTLDQELARVMEPRTSSPAARLRAVAALSAAGIDVEVMTAPIIPGLNDSEVPAILAAARDAGARRARYVLLRLPSTVRDVFLDWLRRQRPNHAAKVEAFIRSTRAGKLYNSKWRERQLGRGLIAQHIENTFNVFAKKYGLDGDHEPLNAADFRPPRPLTGQLNLF